MIEVSCAVAFVVMSNGININLPQWWTLTLNLAPRNI